MVDYSLDLQTLGNQEPFVSVNYCGFQQHISLPCPSWLPSFQVNVSFWKKLQNSFGNNFKNSIRDSIYFKYTNRQN